MILNEDQLKAEGYGLAKVLLKSVAGLDEVDLERLIVTGFCAGAASVVAAQREGIEIDLDELADKIGLKRAKPKPQKERGFSA